MAIIPRYGDWITFPLEQVSPVEIEWWSDKTQQRTRYYVDKCWFGERVDSTDSESAYGKGLAPKGETLIFIASEYIESRMQGAPHLLNLHLMDIMRKKYHENDLARNWALLQLNEKFHYGQNNKQTFRWIVYHPPAIAGRERKMYQHRFVENVALKIADIGIELAGVAVTTGTGAVTAGAVQVEGVVPMLTRMKNLFAANHGHGLHQFSPSEQVLPISPKPQPEKPKKTSVTLSNGTVVEVIEQSDSTLPNISVEEVNMINIVDVQDEKQDIPSYTGMPGVSSRELSNIQRGRPGDCVQWARNPPLSTGNQ
ncbi:hypothetical protein COCVIDRAFT_84651 [Bipolaris victoriae FI3]|uniref:Uncharacterized protein n=1 Tax=Bipolaris victoriae (strain FI3) TaxID=930091 RepID=W7FA33_BIPV3|nr:hypothetical protein COCVIDRAFT_84651 [Bipolaris victoriae FI3]